jgi:hypothetical protein
MDDIYKKVLAWLEAKLGTRRFLYLCFFVVILVAAFWYPKAVELLCEREWMPDRVCYGPELSGIPKGRPYLMLAVFDGDARDSAGGLLAEHLRNMEIFVVRYNHVVKSNSEAEHLRQRHKASAIIWGTLTASTLLLHSSLFRHNPVGGSDALVLISREGNSLKLAQANEDLLSYLREVASVYVGLQIASQVREDGSYDSDLMGRAIERAEEVRRSGKRFRAMGPDGQIALLESLGLGRWLLASLMDRRDLAELSVRDLTEAVRLAESPEDVARLKVARAGSYVLLASRFGDREALAAAKRDLREIAPEKNLKAYTRASAEYTHGIATIADAWTLSDRRAALDEALAAFARCERAAATEPKSVDARALRVHTCLARMEVRLLQCRDARNTGTPEPKTAASRAACGGELDDEMAACAQLFPENRSRTFTAYVESLHGRVALQIVRQDLMESDDPSRAFREKAVELQSHAHTIQNALERLNTQGSLFYAARGHADLAELYLAIVKSKAEQVSADARPRASEQAKLAIELSARAGPSIRIDAILGSVAVLRDLGSYDLALSYGSDLADLATKTASDRVVAAAKFAIGSTWAAKCEFSETSTCEDCQKALAILRECTDLIEKDESIKATFQSESLAAMICANQANRCAFSCSDRYRSKHRRVSITTSLTARGR